MSSDVRARQRADTPGGLLSISSSGCSATHRLTPLVLSAHPLVCHHRLVAPEDRGEFVDSLARMCFSMQSNTAMPHISHIFRVRTPPPSTSPCHINHTP